jgi:hypothetical protein
MSSYFDQFDQTIGDAVQRLAHKPRHVRLLRRVRRRPGFAVVIAALVIAAPALGAVTHWYGLGAPNHPQSEAPAFGVGSAIPGTAKLLSLRVTDSQGGPPWGIRIVSTQHGSCQEVGRVENGQLGSLGIDGYWHDDHLFHPFPANWVGESCGSAGGAPGSTPDGGGAGIYDASANVPTYRNGTQTDGCTIEREETLDGRRLLHAAPGPQACPRESLRIVMFVSLGSQAKSIAYRNPGGGLRTEQSPDGTFLLVFPLNATTCRQYLNGQLTSNGACDRIFHRNPSRLSDPLSAAISRINLSDGKSCLVTGPGLLSNCPAH